MNSNHTTALTGVLEKIVFFNDENFTALLNYP